MRFMNKFVKLIFLISVSILAQNKLDVVVLDAGHGGKDPGTKGVKTGVFEKDIVLPITLKLGQLIEMNYPHIKVIYTRKTDEFIELKERTRIANSKGGKLFISIHANHKKKEESDKSGTEIYILNRDRMTEAVHITMNEDKSQKYSLYGNDTTDMFIFSSLARNGYIILSSQLSSGIERNITVNTPLISRGVYQSGFWVLSGASMPSVLIEAGYLSSESDESYLTDQKAHTEIAEALFSAFRSYKRYFEILY
jgi:N-acetylmuramoyl-L-alanine amidase